jgi:outer membrane receptor protein involved in Fe transport
VINRLPQAYPEQNAGVTNGATGTATVDLRFLGAERTLVLIDGKRLMPGDPVSGSIAPDLNFIPSALVERVEVVTGGASAVYGSDAIAGVVNFIIRKDLSGVRLDATAGGYDHVNGDAQIQALVSGSGSPVPAHRVEDGWTWSLDLAAGVDSPDGKGNLSVYGGYRRAEPVTEATRDFAACGLTDGDSGLVCQGSTRSTQYGRFSFFDADFNAQPNLTLDPTGPGDTLRRFKGPRDAYNFAPYQYFQRPDVRWTGGGFGRYQLSPAAELYLQGMFMDDRSTAQLAPSGLFPSAATHLSCSNPMLSAAEVQTFCTNGGIPPDGQVLMYIGRRNVEGGPRRYSLHHRDWRVLAGAHGQLGDWSYDASAQYSAVAMDTQVEREVSLAHAADALNVVRNASGQLVCASGNPGCAPYDIFKIGGVTQAALDYLSVPSSATGSTSETVVSATVTGQLGRYGLKSPFAEKGAAIALGAEYRRESLAYEPDAELASGDLASSGAAEPAASGAFHVFELYGELRAPLVEDRGRWLHQITVEAGGRYSRYSAAGGVWTYKAGAEWAPSPDLRFRASFNHAVRAPNAVNLFTPQVINQTSLNLDPCAGADPLSANPFATTANCARTGVSANQYGHIIQNPDGYNVLNGGNPDLKPESADTITAGLVLTPRALPGFSLAADWYDIRVKSVMDTLGADLVIEQCLETGDPFFCRLVHRSAATGSLWLGADGYVIDILQNASGMRVAGVDVQADWRTSLPRVAGRDIGAIVFSLTGTWVESASSQATGTSVSFDCAGFYGATCGTPMPRWRHLAQATWTSPWRFDLTGAWRYIGSTDRDQNSTNPVLAGPSPLPNAALGAVSYFDLSLAWRPSPRLTLRVGANNLLDRDPPLVPAFGGGVNNGNTYVGFYDALGRFIFVGLTARY